VAGASWEGFIVEQLLAAAPAVEASFYRTAHGAEADLVLRFRDGETWVVEIKRSSAPTVSKASTLAAADVGATRKLLVAPVATPIRCAMASRSCPARGGARRVAAAAMREFDLVSSPVVGGLVPVLIRPTGPAGRMSTGTERGGTRMTFRGPRVKFDIDAA